jgi:adenylate cyclase
MTVLARLRRFVPLNTWSLTLAIAIAGVALFTTGVPILDLLELRAYDLRFLARGPRAPSPAVILAMIDEKSLDTEGRWPWPRAKLAALVDKLSDDGAKVVAFDIGFLEPDQNADLEMLDRVDQTVGRLGVVNPELTQLFATYRQRADNDGALARSVAASRAAIVLGYFFHMSQRDLEYAIDDGEIQRRFALIAPSKYPIVTGRDADIARAGMPHAYAPEINLPPITEAAKASGYFTVKQDSDSIVRWMPLVIRGGTDLYPPLSLLAAYYYLDEPPLAVRIDEYGVDSIQIGDRFIPTDATGRLLINYVGPPKTFAHYSVGDIIEGKVPAGTFRDHVVLVGATATGIYDVRSTPFSPTFPGAEIHATVIDNILTGQFMAKPAGSPPSTPSPSSCSSCSPGWCSRASARFRVCFSRPQYSRFTSSSCAKPSCSTACGSTSSIRS